MEKINQLKLDLNETIAKSDNYQMMIISERLDQLIDDFMMERTHKELEQTDYLSIK